MSVFRGIVILVLCAIFLSLGVLWDLAVREEKMRQEGLIIEQQIKKLDNEVVEIREKIKEQEEINRIKAEELQEEMRKKPEVSRGTERKGYLATAYTPYECGGRRTSSGTTATEGRTIAMSVYTPLGSHVMLVCPSYPLINGKYVVEDRGGDIKGNRVDIFMENYDKALRFGRREVFITSP